MFSLEDKLIHLVSKYLTVENSLSEDPITLTTTISFKGKSIYTHDLSLEPLVPLLKKKLSED
jgi:hypothetical protein